MCTCCFLKVLRLPPSSACLDEIATLNYAKARYKASFRLQALDRIVPGPELYDQIGPIGGYLGLFLIGSMTLIVLIPACSNYVSLSISQSLERMKEIGVLKVMGGQKKQIILQFIVESTLIVLLALLLSYPIFDLVRAHLLHQMVETSPMDLSPTWATFVGYLSIRTPGWFSGRDCAGSLFLQHLARQRPER